jgi:hypothetical protein
VHAAVPIDEDVVGLEIAVDGAGPVRCGEALRRLREGPEDLADAALLSAQPPREALTVDQLHRYEDVSLERSDLVHAYDVRMVEARHGARFAEQVHRRRTRAGA